MAKLTQRNIFTLPVPPGTRHSYRYGITLDESGAGPLGHC